MEPISEENASNNEQEFTINKLELEKELAYLNVREDLNDPAIYDNIEIEDVVLEKVTTEELDYMYDQEQMLSEQLKRKIEGKEEDESMVEVSLQTSSENSALPSDIKKVPPRDVSLKDKSLDELGIRVTAPFPGAVAGEDYTDAEVDEETGGLIISGMDPHVQAKLVKQMDPKEKEEMEETVKQHMLNYYGITDPVTGEYRIGNPKNSDDLVQLQKQRGWTIKTKMDSVPKDMPKLSGSFRINPDKYLSPYNVVLPIDTMKQKIILMGNAIVYEMYTCSSLHIDMLVKTPEILSLVSGTITNKVMNASALIKVIKHYCSILESNYEFDRHNDFTMSTTGEHEDIPELSLMSLNNEEKTLLALDDPKGKAPTESLCDDPSRKDKGKEKTEQEIEEDESVVHPPLKQKLKRLVLPIDYNTKPYDWCPALTTNFKDAMEMWYSKSKRAAEKAAKSRSLEIKKEQETVQNTDIDSLYWGEKIHTWFCCFKSREIDNTALSAFFKRWVRTTYLIRLVNRDINEGTAGTKASLLGLVLLPIVEHWLVQCKQDITVRNIVFPERDNLIAELSSGITREAINLMSQGKLGNDYNNNITTFLSKMATDYVLGKLWKDENDILFEYPTQNQIISLCKIVEDVIGPIDVEHVATPSLVEFETFHIEWAYHWKNREMANMEEHLVRDISNAFNIETNRLATKKETINISTEEVLNSFTFLENVYLQTHANLLLRISVEILYLELLCGRWMSDITKKIFGYTPSENLKDDVVLLSDVFEVTAQRHVFMRRANMLTKMRSVGIEPTSIIYKNVTLQEDEEYPELDLKEVRPLCLYGNASFPEIDLVKDFVQYVIILANKDGQRPDPEKAQKLMEQSIAKKPSFRNTEDVTEGSKYSPDEIQKMMEIVREYELPEENKPKSKKKTETSKRKGRPKQYSQKRRSKNRRNKKGNGNKKK